MSSSSSGRSDATAKSAEGEEEEKMLMLLEEILAPPSPGEDIFKGTTTTTDDETDTAAATAGGRSAAAEGALAKMMHVSPEQLGEILQLRKEYYVYLDVLVYYYQAMPVATWMLQTLTELAGALATFSTSTTTAAAAVDLEADIMRAAYKKLNKLVEENSSSSDDDDGRQRQSLLLSNIRADVGLPQNDPWLPVLDAVGDLLHLEGARDTIGVVAHYTASSTAAAAAEFINRLSTWSAKNNDGSSSKRQQLLQQYSQSLLEPPPEWRLQEMLDLRPNSSSSSGQQQQRHRMMSPEEEAIERKNGLQLSHEARTVQGMRAIVQNAREEAEEYRELFNDTTAKSAQFVELIQRLVTKQQQEQKSSNMDHVYSSFLRYVGIIGRLVQKAIDKIPPSRV